MKLKYILLIATIVGFSKINAGDILTPAHPKTTLKATKTSRPGNLVGCDLAFSRNSYHNSNAGKKSNISTSGSFSIIPTFQFNVASNWAASIGLRVDSYNGKYDNAPFHSEEKEMSYGPSLSIYHYCDDPCDEDDWSPFVGANVGYYAGPRKYITWDDNTPNQAHHVENGKISSFEGGIFTGTYYRLNDNFGAMAKVSLFDFNTYKTVYSKSSPDSFGSNSHFDLFSGGNVGIYYNLGERKTNEVSVDGIST